MLVKGVSGRYRRGPLLQGKCILVTSETVPCLDRGKGYTDNAASLSVVYSLCWGLRNALISIE